MRKESAKKVYRKPRVVSEKVFEQAALACSCQDLGNNNGNLKNSAITCEFAHS